MIRQRRFWALAFLLLWAASSARAQQVFISRIWVNHKAGTPGGGTTCGVVLPDGGIAEGKGQMRCYDDNVGASCLAPAGIQYPQLSPWCGNISNEPHIEFNAPPDSAAGYVDCAGKNDGRQHPLFPQGVLALNACNEKVNLCVQVGYSNKQSGATSFALDYINFEVFKYQEGSNPLDPGSTPPLRTFYIDNPGSIDAGQEGVLWPVCAMWDGSINIKGEYGKSNGQYGFRATVATNQTGQSGNINITQTRAYPGGWARDAGTDWNGWQPRTVDAKPILVDVVDIHVVRSSPTVVGDLTGVAAEPYNITYRLSKDATTYITVYKYDAYTDAAGNSLGMTFSPVRHIVEGQPRVGEGIPSGTLQNGDSWNGRWDNGDLGPPGVYMAYLYAESVDQYGFDHNESVTRQVALDTLQITDLRVQPLDDKSTSLAVLSYVLTEPATVYIDIYPPGTAFVNMSSTWTNQLNEVNFRSDSVEGSALANAGASKNFYPVVNVQPGNPYTGTSVLPIKHIEEHKDYRKSEISFWDGRDQSGRLVDDGNYVFVIYAALPSQNGFPYRGHAYDRRIWSTNAKSGYIPVSRGLITISQVGPSSTVIGSSPSVAGLDPFTFSYSLSRDANVSLKIFDQNGSHLVRTLVDNETRPGNFLNRERWIPAVDDSGHLVSSGTYLVQLTASDPFFPNRVSTTTAMFPIDLFRIVDVGVTPLLTGSTDVVTLSYQLSQPMRVAWNIYAPGTIVRSDLGWPPCGMLEPSNCAQITDGHGNKASPLITIRGMRPGRLRITEFWDGRDINGLFVPDGNYVYLLVAQATTTVSAFATDKIMGDLTVARGSIVFPVFNITPTFPTLFNSSQTISLPPYEVDYSLTRQSSVTIQVLTMDLTPRVVRSVIVGQVRDANILNREFWDARDDSGNFVKPGFYTIRAVAEDLASLLSSGSTAQQTISVDPLRVYDVAISPLRPDFGTGLIAYQISETMKTSVKIYKPGTVFDGNGNPTPPERVSLVKKFVGVRPSRTEISETWDGTDETLSYVPDGNYLFRIVASTDIHAIDTMTGNVMPGAALAEDLVIAEVPVVRGSSADPEADFEKHTFIYPNPIRGGSATFRIFVPFEATVKMKIYNIAGELVRDEDFGKMSDTLNSSIFEWKWNLTNHAGRALAPGVYFAVIRESATRGEMAVFQTVKKFLIP